MRKLCPREPHGPQEEKKEREKESLQNLDIQKQLSSRASWPQVHRGSYEPTKHISTQLHGQ